jgi:hypothetical protein
MPLKTLTMDILLVDQTITLTSSAPGKFFTASTVCFKDGFYIFLHVPAYTFHVNQTPDYGFGEKSVPEGLKGIIASCSNESELREKLDAIIPNSTLVINFSDYKKAKVSGLFGTKTLKVSNSALNYVSFNASKDAGKSLAQFYAHL